MALNAKKSRDSFNKMIDTNESKHGIFMQNPYDALTTEFTPHKSKVDTHVGAPKWTKEKFKTEF